MVKKVIGKARTQGKVLKQNIYIFIKPPSSMIFNIRNSFNKQQKYGFGNGKSFRVNKAKQVKQPKAKKPLNNKKDREGLTEWPNNFQTLLVQKDDFELEEYIQYKRGRIKL